MTRDKLTIHQKAFRVNMDADKYGTVAEIGAGQEVARWFFQVGGAAGTIAKSMSAYDMAVSNAIYGPSRQYVSRERLLKMIDYEYGLLENRLREHRGDTMQFFAFANTVTARSYLRQDDECHGWMGIRFQHQGSAPESTIIIHLRMLDRENVQQQEVLGILGVNLIYGAFHLHDAPDQLVGSLLDSLTNERVEVDLIRFSGPAFAEVDNRIMALELVTQGLTEAAIFGPDGEVVQAGEALYKKAILVERGSFRPVTRATMDMLDCAKALFVQEPQVQGESIVVLAEMPLRKLSVEDDFGHRDFLDRVDLLTGLRHTVLISNSIRYFRLAAYLSRYTKKMIGIAMGVPSLREMFQEEYYHDLEGGILESMGRLFKNDLKVYVYPLLDAETGAMITADNLRVAPNLRHLYAHLLENQVIESLRDFDPDCLAVFPRDVLFKIRGGDPSWRDMVPPQVMEIIEERGLFGLSPDPGGGD